MIQVLGIPMYELGITRATNDVIETITGNFEKQNRCVSATGAHGLVQSRSDKSFAEVLKGFYWNLPDGVPALWVGRLKGAKEMQRCYGPLFFEEVILSSASTQIKHFFCGGKEGVAGELKQVCEERFGNHNCVGTFSPPFREMSSEELRSLGDMINSSGADIVWIGLSTPKQELFAKRLSDFVKVKFIITVGAAFDFHTGKVKEAPKFMQRNGLEWLFRLTVEPKRLFGRYLKVVPAFLFYGTVDVLTFYYQKIRGGKYAG